MKVVTEDKPAVVAANAGVANGYSRLYNKLDGSTVDVHTVDAKEYVRRLPHLWSYSPVAKERAKAEDAVIVPEPAKESEKEVVAKKPAEPEAPATSEEKPISARSRRLAKLED